MAKAPGPTPLKPQAINKNKPIIVIEHLIDGLISSLFFITPQPKGPIVTIQVNGPLKSKPSIRGETLQDGIELPVLTALFP
ncbi:hypothetical protein [Entomobacter blattae]|uniref:hypothetical protein n=1 Tax=Entomobacter blattae TaxID=2762277 RepID=UPI00193C59DD|nr:hypothetical protein [Entomobacter blattae]